MVQKGKSLGKNNKKLNSNFNIHIAIIKPVFFIFLKDIKLKNQ